MLGRLFPSNMIALLGTWVRGQIFTWHGPERGNSFHNFFVDALIVILTIAAILYVVSRVTSLKSEIVSKLNR